MKLARHFFLSSCFILFRPALFAASASRASKRSRLLSGLLFIILFLLRPGFLREALKSFGELRVELGTLTLLFTFYR